MDNRILSDCAANLVASRITRWAHWSRMQKYGCMSDPTDQGEMAACREILKCAQGRHASWGDCQREYKQGVLATEQRMLERGDRFCD